MADSRPFDITGSPLTRRRFLGATALGGLAVAVPWSGLADRAAAARPASNDLKTLKFQLDWITNAQYSGWYMGDDAGDFAAEGLELSLLPGADVASHEAVLAGGGADFAISSYLSRLVDAVNADAEILLVGALFQRSPAGLMSSPDAPIKTPEDILGKRIGIQEGGQNEIDTILTLAGLPLDYTAVPVGYDPTPLAEGAVDAYYCYVTSQPLTFDQQGIPYALVTFEELGWPQYGALVCVRRDYLDANRDTVVGFMRASVKGWERAVADPQAAADLTIDRYGVDLALDPRRRVRHHPRPAPAAAERPHGEQGLVPGRPGPHRRADVRRVASFGSRPTPRRRHDLRPDHPRRRVRGFLHAALVIEDGAPPPMPGVRGAPRAQRVAARRRAQALPAGPCHGGGVGRLRPRRARRRDRRPPRSVRVRQVDGAPPRRRLGGANGRDGVGGWSSAG